MEKPIHYGWSGSLRCKLWSSKPLLWSFMMSSTMNLMAINLERYISVVYPVLHRASIKTGNQNPPKAIPPW